MIPTNRVKATAASVAAICDEMSQRGERPTQQNLRLKVNGSTRDIQKYLDEWWAEYMARGSSSDRVLPRTAVQLEIEGMVAAIMSRATESAQATAELRYHRRRADIEGQLTQANDAKNRAEETKTRLEIDLENSRMLHAQSVSIRESTQASLDFSKTQIDYLDQRVKAAEAALADERQRHDASRARHEAERDAWATSLAELRTQAADAHQALVNSNETLRAQLADKQASTGPT